jgi:hypothetical protein
MPRHQRIAEAREKAIRIREYAAAFRSELRLQRITEIQPKTEADKPNVRVFVVQLPTRKSRKEAA